jgi:N-acetylglucosamine kinase-like BadF-type ATPase
MTQDWVLGIDLGGTKTALVKSAEGPLVFQAPLFQSDGILLSC